MAVFTGQAYPSARPGPTATRPTYVMTLQAAPGHDDIRSLRALLKTAGRRYGLRVVSVHEMPPPPPTQNSPDGDVGDTPPSGDDV
jgi:hypothetical protein